VLLQLQLMYLSDDAAHPSLYLEEDWCTQPHSRGCYAGENLVFFSWPRNGNPHRPHALNCSLNRFRNRTGDRVICRLVGAYPPGLITTVKNAARSPCGRVHFASTEGSEKFYGYMEGAGDCCSLSTRYNLLKSRNRPT
jgi:hypothetical protein